MTKEKSKYENLIEVIFFSKYKVGLREFTFHRKDLEKIAEDIKIRNLGDAIYSYRYRKYLPDSINATAPNGYEWIIKPAGTSQYCFTLRKALKIIPNEYLSETKVPDSTPSIIEQYALSDEQALLAKIRYNRLIDIFTGVTCYSLQNHLRTNVRGIGQLETDEVYIGIDKFGIQYINPVQAKGGRDRIGSIQIEQDKALCCVKFGALVCRPVAAQFMKDGIIALFEFDTSNDALAISAEKHYRLVPSKEISETELINYQRTRRPT